MKDFDLHTPKDMAETHAVLARYGNKARILAGGTDLLPDLKRGAADVQHLVSISSLDELKNIETKDNELWIGALVTLGRIAESGTVRKFFRALAEAASTMGSTQIRNMGTIGGNVASAVSCADLPPSLIAARADVRIIGPGGERRVPLYKFFLGPRQTVLRSGEVLGQLIVPHLPANTGISYKKVELRNANTPSVVGVASRITLKSGVVEDCLVVLGAVAPTPTIAKKASALLTGSIPDQELFARAAKTAVRESKPIGDVRGSKQYREDLVEVLTSRALQEAYQRAKEDGV